MPKEVSIETLFHEDKKKYLAIISFAIDFSNKKNWLRLYHYRYALQKNHNLSPSFQHTITKTFESKLQQEYNNPYSFIKQCFQSRSNLIAHINRLVDIDILDKKKINDEYRYRFNNNCIEELLYAFDCAWFNTLRKKVPHEVLHKIKIHIEQEFKSELQQYNALYYSINITGE